MYKNGIPQFDGKKYAFWSIRMNTYIHAQFEEISTVAPFTAHYVLYY